MPNNVTACCPYCGQTLQPGAVGEIPFLYCDSCSIGWGSFEDLDHSFVLDDEGRADQDAAEQWMWDHGGYSYQESPDPSGG